MRLNPEDGSVYYNLGAAYSNKKQYSQAAEEYLRAIEFDSEMPNAHKGLAFVFYQLGKYSQAWEHIKTAQDLGAEVEEDLIRAVKKNLH